MTVQIPYTFQGSERTTEQTIPKFDFGWERYDFRYWLVSTLIRIHHPDLVNPLTAGRKNPATGDMLSHSCVLTHYGITLKNPWDCYLEAGHILGEDDLTSP
jgi:hypothetical protein